MFNDFDEVEQKDEFGIYKDDIEIEDIDFSIGDIGVNYLSKLQKELAEDISENSEVLGVFDDSGISSWRVHKFKNSYYIELSDFKDFFPVNKTILARLN